MDKKKKKDVHGSNIFRMYRVDLSCQSRRSGFPLVSLLVTVVKLCLSVEKTLYHFLFRERERHSFSWFGIHLVATYDENLQTHRLILYPRTICA